MNNNKLSRKTIAQLGAVSALALASAQSFAACSANIMDYQIEVFSSTTALSANPQATVYPTSHSNAYNFKVLGGGAVVNTISGDAFLTASYPDLDNGAPVGWIAESKAMGTGVQARLTTYVVAINDPENCWDVQAFQNSTTTPVAHPAASVSVGAGYALTGGGAKAVPQTAGGHGNFLFSSMPSNGGGATYNGWSVQSKDHAVSDHANITAYAIGIKAVGAGVAQPTVSVSPSRPSASSNNPAAQARGFNSVYPGVNCVLTGGGANDNWGNGYGNMLTATYPAGTGGWEGIGGWYGSQNAAIMTAYAVCLN